MKHRLRVCAAITLNLIQARPASAADWHKIGGFIDGYFDNSTLRNEQFPIIRKVMDAYFPTGQYATYLSVWIKTPDSHGGALLYEILMDCNSHYAVQQQIVPQGTPSSDRASFDLTQTFKSSGVPMTDVPPDSLIDAAQNEICKATRK